MEAQTQDNDIVFATIKPDLEAFLGLQKNWDGVSFALTEMQESEAYYMLIFERAFTMYLRTFAFFRFFHIGTYTHAKPETKKLKKTVPNENEFFR